MVDATSPFILTVGLILGLEHAFDVDHVVAVTNLLCNVKSFNKSLFLGTVWASVMRLLYSLQVWLFSL